MLGWLRVLRWMGIAAVIAAAAAGLLVVSAYALLQSEAGRARVVEILNRQLSAAGGVQVRIGRLEGDLTNSVVLRDVTLSDGDGTWLRLSLGSASWRPAALFSGTLSIANLDLDGLQMLRRPRSRNAQSGGEFRWPDLPFGVSIGRFSLRDAVLAQPVLGERVAFRASGDTAIEGPDLVRTTVGVTRSDGVSGEAQLDAVLRPRSKRLRFALMLDEAGGGLLARALALDGLPSLSIEAGGDGPLNALRGNVRMRAGDLALVQASFTIDVTDRPALQLAGRARLAPLAGERLGGLLSDEVAFDADAELTKNGIVLRQASLANDLVRVEGSGELRGRAADFDVTIAVNDLAPFAGMARFPLRGQARIRSRIRSDDIRRAATASIEATLSNPLAPQSPLRELLGARLSVAGSVAFDAERYWAVRDLVIAGESVKLTASATMSADAARLDGEYELTLPRLAALSDMVGSALAGELAISGEFGGSFADPNLTARIVSPALSVGDVVVGAVEARANITQFTNAVRGNLDLSLDNDRIGAVAVASKFSGDTDGTFRFDALVVESRGTRLTGAVRVNLSDATATGKLAGQAISLASWSDLAGRALSGSASVAFGMSGRGAAQQVDLAVEVDGLDVTLGPVRSLSVDKLVASARVEDLFGAPSGAMGLVATDSKIADFQLTRVVFESRMEDPSRASASLQVQGNLNGPFALQADGDYSARDRGFVVTVSELGASLSGQSVKLSQPARFARGGQTTALSKSVLSVAGGEVTVEGEIGAEKINARLELERISLAAVDALVPMAAVTGTLSGTVQVSGSRAAPSGRLELTANGVRSANSTLAGVPPVSGRLRGDWRDGRLRLDASLAEIAETSIDARVSVPLRLDPVSLALGIPADGAIDGEMRWSGELGPVWDLLSPYEDRFTGPGELAVTLAGTVGRPQISGYFQVPGGRYENVQSGTTLADVELRLVGDGDRLVLERLTAGDTKRGTLTGSGTIDFIPSRSYPTNLRLDFGDMLLVARDDLILNASGKLLLEGTFSNALLSGEIVTGNAELSLAGTLPPEVVELDVEEINVDQGAQPGKRQPAGAQDASVLILDLDIAVPGRAFVRGLGLDSEWQGEVKISGNANAPNVAGVLSPVRGQFSLMGKRFRLDRGAIRFTGSDELDPLLDLTAEHQAGSLTAIVRVTGSASKPKISLTSRPPLPESEIASQVLFGTESNNLSAAQSLQLASAIATYSGTGGAVGVLDATRRALGVDTINFAESEQDPDSTRVSVGKYVTDGVYIEVERGAGESSRTTTTVEVEVARDVRVEGGTTETGGNEVGVKWRWDY